MDIKAMAQEIIEAGKAVFDRIKTIHGVDGAIAALPEVIRAVETKASEVTGMTGAQKKELAVEVINALVDIPFLPEKLEGILIGWAIDAVIAALNKLVGKDWLAVSENAAAA